MKLQLDQLLRYDDWEHFRISLISETEKEKSKFPVYPLSDTKTIQSDRLMKDIEISMELVGTEKFADEVKRAIIEIYKDWEYLKSQ